MRIYLLIATLIIIPTLASAADVPVTQSHTTFDLDEMTIKAGDTVVFKNKDDVTHNIQVSNSDGAIDDKGLQKPGVDIRETLSAPGSYKVRCAIHPRMKLSIKVN